MVAGVPYRCTLDVCAGGRNPAETPDDWEAMDAFPDDLRIRAGTAHEGTGLAY